MEAHQKERNKKTQRYLPLCLEDTFGVKEINEKLLSELEATSTSNQHVYEIFLDGNRGQKVKVVIVQSALLKLKREESSLANVWNPKVCNISFIKIYC